MVRISENLLIGHCSPTMAGLKTGNIFTCAVYDQEELHDDLRKLNRMLSPKGLRILPLRYFDNKAVIYLYRPKRLEQDLEASLAREILARCGYSGGDANSMLVQLMRRFRTERDFPHEIGLFLGYPPEDVKGFIDNNAENCKCVGAWKVYGNPEEAQEMFERFRKCTKAYSEQLLKGRSVERLIVAV